MKRGCVLNVWIGELPEHFGIWKITARANTSYDFYVFTDGVKERHTDGNITLLPITLDELKDRVQRTIGRPYARLDATNIHKLCDLKVAFGHVFEEVADAYEWWAWTDLDAYYGCFDTFITEEVLHDHDFIGFKNSPAGLLNDNAGKARHAIRPVTARLFGPFCMARREHKYLYQRIPEYREKIVGNSLGIYPEPSRRGGESFIDEFDMAECIEAHGLRMYTHFKKEGFAPVHLIRTGNPRWPKIWKNGVLTIPEQPGCSREFRDTVGFETLVMHMGAGRHLIRHDPASDTIRFDSFPSLARLAGMTPEARAIEEAREAEARNA